MPPRRNWQPTACAKIAGTKAVEASTAGTCFFLVFRTARQSSTPNHRYFPGVPLPNGPGQRKAVQYIAQSKQGPDRIYDLRREPRSTSRRPSAWLGLNGVHNDIFCGALTERQFARRECARIVNIDRAMVPASQGPGQASDKQLSLVKGTADHRNDIDGQRAGWKLPRPAGPQQ